MLGLKDKIIAKKHPWRIIEGEAIIVDVRKSKIIHFNDIGTFIWKYLMKRRNIKDVISKISKEYKIQSSSIKKDITEFIGKLIKRGLVEYTKD